MSGALTTEAERRKYRRSRYTVSFALAGLLDISLSCLVLARLGVLESLLWGLVGAAAYALVYVAISLSGEALGLDPESDASASSDDGGGPFARFLADVDEEDEDEDDLLRWWENLGWVLLAGVIMVGGILWYCILFSVKSILVVAVFASVSSESSFLGFLVVVVVSGAVQFLAMAFGFMPAAKRRGFAL